LTVKWKQVTTAYFKILFLVGINITLGYGIREDEIGKAGSIYERERERGEKHLKFWFKSLKLRDHL
jgi:hypothetical protein